MLEVNARDWVSASSYLSLGNSWLPNSPSGRPLKALSSIPYPWRGMGFICLEICLDWVLGAKQSESLHLAHSLEYCLKFPRLFFQSRCSWEPGLSLLPALAHSFLIWFCQNHSCNCTEHIVPVFVHSLYFINLQNLLFCLISKPWNFRLCGLKFLWNLWILFIKKWKPLGFCPNLWNCLWLTSGPFFSRIPCREHVSSFVRLQLAWPFVWRMYLLGEGAHF